ncbi:2-polyprenyl-6-methoxyphenol hydroxylase-like FAD-dependent oxidoreductase [Nocardia transvalensis]|uniref:2-polyprenyl-6-methoxyphenol hydroxylase-like FAD-dependent oxidoreductase n=1 Tax=Nocardia transvalensis TaxID=37333 RepID=A0A7W9PFD8_9NOCA|nr:FAD-dependent monooxygenase [Nocardia transvalensis]MBB5914905.1 2-polyprenyl-6-methoxyphenol hydroxylase-like FAD-dependent oxidoreductase [Nocardia transvalensis]
MTIPATTSVVIVGAGPAGLTAAIALADAGVDFVLLDAQAEGANTSRAAVVHARTLEVLDGFGIAGELHDLGIEVPRFVLQDGPARLATVGFGGLPTAYPYTLMVGQETTEAVLLARLRTAGGDVHRPYRVTGLTDDGAGVTVEFTDAAGVSGSIRAEYVIGADGMHSVVREQAGIGFTGATYPESFVLADVRMTWPDRRDEVSLNLSPEGVTVVAPLPGDRYRVVATVAEAPEHPTHADVQAILDARRPGAVVREVVWSSRFRVHHRVADHYRAGRVLLAGDAAHVHSPAGGQGMNTGIQDAAALGALLIRVLDGAPESLLNDYEKTRRPVALGVVAFTDRMTRMATLRARPARLVRNAVVRAVTRIPAVRKALAYRLSELANR